MENGIRNMEYGVWNITTGKGRYSMIDDKLYWVSQTNCSTFDKIFKNKDNMNRLMERKPRS